MPHLRSRLDSKSTYFVYWWCHHPAPWPLAFNLLTPRRLITTTTTTVADYMLVFVLQKILSLTCLVVKCKSQQQFDLITGPHKRFWFPCTSHFRLLFLVFSFSFYCLCVYSFGEFQAPSISLEYELKRVELFTMDPFGHKNSWNNVKEDGGGEIVLVHVDMALGCSF